jgi:hypothetical protein
MNIRRSRLVNVSLTVGRSHEFSFGGVAALAMALVVLCLAGCTEKPKPSRQGAKKNASGTTGTDVFALTIDNLNHLEDFQTQDVPGQIRRQAYELGKASDTPARPDAILVAAWPEIESMRQIVDRLNQWIRSQQPPEWRQDPLFDQLPEPLKTLPLANGLDKLAIGTFDGYYLQEAVYLRDVARAARGKSIDGRQRASRLFDWVVRNIQLEEDSKDHIPRFPWETLFFGRGTAWERAWVFVLLARQEGLDAAVLGIEQASATATETGQNVKPWCVAVRIDGKAYLFDPLWGLPIPGPGGVRKGEGGRLEITPATLDQLVADESLLKRMSADAEHPYPVTQADLKNVVALVEASPTALSRRMKVVESRLQGKQKMALTASATEQADRWKATPGVSAARLWRLPYETIRQRSELKPADNIKLLANFLPFYSMPSGLLHAETIEREAAETPAELQADIYHGRSSKEAEKSQQDPANLIKDTDEKRLKRIMDQSARFNATFSAPLYKGRVMQLKGQYSSDNKYDPSAMNHFQMARPSQQDLGIIQLKFFGQVVSAYLDKLNVSEKERAPLIANIVEAVLTKKTPTDPMAARIADQVRQNEAPMIQEQMTLILLGKIDASYWLGLVTYERGSYAAAFDYFGKYTMNAWPGMPSPWTAGAIYNLGRTREAEGKADEAARIYRSNATAADAAGQLLRSKWLREVNEEKKPEAEESKGENAAPDIVEPPKAEEKKAEDKKEVASPTVSDPNADAPDDKKAEDKPEKKTDETKPE